MLRVSHNIINLHPLKNNNILTSHFSEALFPRSPVSMRYNLPVPSDKVTHVEDVKWIDAQRRVSHAIRSVGSRNTSRGFPKAVS